VAAAVRSLPRASVWCALARPPSWTPIRGGALLLQVCYALMWPTLGGGVMLAVQPDKDSFAQVWSGLMQRRPCLLAAPAHPQHRPPPPLPLPTSCAEAPGIQYSHARGHTEAQGRQPSNH
jgi:hypothetical protein